jgi:hypothetical protein
VVPEDDTEFQSLLKNDKEAVYPNISAELTGVDLKEEKRDFTPVLDDPTRARRDIQTVDLFLTMRVKNPDEDDWGAN